MSPREGRGELAWAVVFMLGYLAILLLTVDELGYARDEGFYFVASQRYQAWFELLATDPNTAMASRDEAWRVNSEHPALVKSLFALCHRVLWDAGPFVSREGTSFRVGGMLLSSLAVGMTYLWGARARGRWVGLLAAGFLAFTPRFFFHAHLACFDGPIVGMWLATAYLWWRLVERGGWWRVVVLGLVFGLTLNTKHNAWFLPIVCGLHGAVLMFGARERVCWALRGLAAMAGLGPIVLLASWPWLWRESGARWWAYAQFHLEHVYYNMELFGQNHWAPPMPRSYAPVMTMATVPIVSLLCAAVGVWLSRREVGPWLRVAWRRLGPRRFGRAASWHLSRRARTTVFWALAIVVPYSAWLRPTTPIFGGTKHWLTTYPFLMLFAALGGAAAVVWLVDRLRREGVRVRASAVAAAVAACLLAAPVIETMASHPWGLSSYSPLVGGAPGGASLGLNRGFWGYQTGALVDVLNREVPPHGSVYLHDTAGQAWDMLRRDGRVRPDIRVAWDAAQADVVIYHHELHMRGQEYQAWVACETVAPSAVAGLDGVPVVWTYDCRPRQW